MPAKLFNAEDAIERILARLPEDASIEHVQDHLYVLQHIDRGRRYIEEGRVISAEEVERRIKRLLSSD